MSEKPCPQCQKELVWQEGRYVCEACHQAYLHQADCPDCGKPLEKLNACGAASFFCNHCNELKSRSRAIRRFEAVSH
uniref:zinc ribbon domain-containing protein n=1 Tax=Thaumasiovibrio occultus TaxID=1891184 RepID=UPI000B35D593|nr:zinc ribbon domain-containing protein [Thaumasiovibrio occultus]